MEIKRFIPFFYVFVPSAAFRVRSGKQAPLSGQRRIAGFLPESAGVHHAEVADREVELDRIDGIDRAQ